MIVELDKARETLALKAVNKPLTYAVKDIAMDLQLFPSFDGNNVQFITAQPGQQGASKISIQLGSITDQQVRETSRLPSKGEVSIDAIEGIDEDTRNNLKKIGVRSVQDVEKLEKKNIDLSKTGVVKTSYRDLSGLIEKSRRAKTPPVVNRVSVTKTADGQELELTGRNLAMAKGYEPVAVINDRLAEVLSYHPEKLRIRVAEKQLKPDRNELVLTLDPFAVCRMDIVSKK
jgi:hypothetical protein